MSYIEDTVIQVEAFYKALDIELALFQIQAKYSCLSGCNKCCHSPNVETTILELLPFAFHLYKENKAEEMYDRLLSNINPSCILFDPTNTITKKGGCSDYQYRALICRLFGFSFTRNKIGVPVLLACKEIKTQHAEAFENIELKARQGMDVPFVSNYYNQLTNIDYHLTLKQYPINEAMKLAIEMVLNHFHYCEPFGEEQRNAS